MVYRGDESATFGVRGLEGFARKEVEPASRWTGRAPEVDAGERDTHVGRDDGGHRRGRSAGKSGVTFPDPFSCHFRREISTHSKQSEIIKCNGKLAKCYICMKVQSGSSSSYPFGARGPRIDDRRPHSKPAPTWCTETSTSVDEECSRQGNPRGGEIDPPFIHATHVHARRRVMVFA